MNDLFRRSTHRASERVGSPGMFALAVAVIPTWGSTGPMYHDADTWQLIINTGTTIITFQMVFPIRNPQNRDALAIHLN
jgi:low affinity Fe/Cu permease